MPKGIVASESGEFLVIDASDLSKLAASLRNVNPAAGRAMRKRLRAAGEVVAEGARRNVLGIPTHSGGQDLAAIASSIKVQASGVGVKVTAGAGVYDAHGRGAFVLTGLLEYGGKGDGRGPWSHPLFGQTGTSYPESPHPYLKPALEEAWPVVSEEVVMALDEGLSAAFRSEGP